MTGPRFLSANLAAQVRQPQARESSGVCRGRCAAAEMARCDRRGSSGLVRALQPLPVPAVDYIAAVPVIPVHGREAVCEGGTQRNGAREQGGARLTTGG